MIPTLLIQTMSAPNPNPKIPAIDFYLSPSEISSSDDDEGPSVTSKNLESSPQKSEASKSTAFHVDDKSVIVVLQEHG